MHIKKLFVSLLVTALSLALFSVASANTGSITVTESCADGYVVTVTLHNNVTLDRTIVVTTTIPGTQGISGHFGPGVILVLTGAANVSGTVTLQIFNGTSLEFTDSVTVNALAGCTKSNTPPNWVVCEQLGKGWGGSTYKVGSYQGTVQDLGNGLGKLSVIFTPESYGKSYELLLNDKLVGTWIVPDASRAGTANWCLKPGMNADPYSVPTNGSSKGVITDRLPDSVLVIATSDPHLVIMVNGIVAYDNPLFIGIEMLPVGWTDAVQIYVDGVLIQSYLPLGRQP